MIKSAIGHQREVCYFTVRFSIDNNIFFKLYERKKYIYK